MITELGDRGRIDARILDKQIVRKEDHRLFQLDLENTGTRVLAPNVTLELFNATGVSAGKFNALSFRLYPTCSVRNQIDLKGVEKGRYSALLLIDSGDESVIGAQYELAIE